MTDSIINPQKEINPDFPRYPSLVHLLDEAVHSAPEQTAIICEDQHLTFAQLGLAVDNLTTTLSSYNIKDKPVAILIPNSIETVIAIFAVMKAGAQASPINSFFTMDEMNKIIKLSDSTLILCVESTKEQATKTASTNNIETLLLHSWETLLWDKSQQQLIDKRPMPDDLALLLFTGGTTGRSKGVDHTHSGLMYSILLHCTTWPLDINKEKILTVAPMFHIWGFSYCVLVAIYTRSTLVIVPQYNPEAVLSAISEHSITVFGGGPAPIYAGLLNHPLMESTDFTRLKYSLSGGAPCPENLHKQWQALTQCPILEGWGMTEGAPFSLSPANGKHKLLSVGNPVPETVIEIVDVETGNEIMPLGETGEVRVKGPQLMKEYHNNPEETANALRDGYMYTGDIGYVDEEGFLFLVDRKKEMIIVGGYNVYPREVEEVLHNHPMIHEAACVGKPDARLGESVVAIIVLNKANEMNEQQVFDYCQEHLIKYKRPTEVRFVDALPRTPAKKIDKLSLRKLVKE